MTSANKNNSRKFLQIKSQIEPDYRRHFIEQQSSNFYSFFHSRPAHIDDGLAWQFFQWWSQTNNYMCERNWARKFPNYELRVSARKEKKETAKSLILYVYSLCTFLKNRNQLKRTFFSKKNASNWLKKVFNIYLHVVGYIFLGPNCDARERGRNYTFFVFHTQIIRRCACVCKKIHFSTMHIHKYSSKKMLFRPGKNNISSNVPAIIICEKNILKINENELHYTRAAVCIRRKAKNWKHFFLAMK